MTISYTTNYNFPKLDDVGQNWGAVINGILDKLDDILKSQVKSVLGSAVVGMQTVDGAQGVYTCPTGKGAIVFEVGLVPTGSVAGGTDFDFGVGTNKDTWRVGVDLSFLTTVGEYHIIRTLEEGETSGALIPTVMAAGEVFGIKPITGATADVNATMYVIGIEFDV